MSILATEPSTIRELDHRTDDSVDVRLLWNAHTGHVFVTVRDLRSGESFGFTVPGGHALEAFHNPYAHRVHGLIQTISTATA